MQSIQDQLNSYREKGRRFKKWKKIVTALACVVVFCTVYALILPAITLEGDTCCNKEEHTHTDACYEEGEASIEKKFVCEKEEVEPHTHSDGCYEIRTIEVPVEETIEVPADEVESVVAAETAETGEGEIEPAAEPATVSETPATKTVTMTRMETKEEKVLVCEKEETEGHAHGDGCYEETEIPGEKTLDCEKEEHKHSKACYANPNADVETETDWEKTFEDVTFTHDWIEDTLAIAKSQLGYNESSDNYIILENGDTKGYTRYGDWYGNKYGDWCAMFVSFCLNYAEVEDFPLEAGCQNWILKIKDLEEASKDEEGVVQYNAWQEATDDYIPERGNIIFFNWDSAPDSDHVGIVVGATTDEKGNTTITTIEGNTSNTVKYKEYTLENTTIMGYGILPAQEFYCGMQGHAHDEDCYDDAGELICEIEEHIHTEECEAASELTEEEQAEELSERVKRVIELIDNLPTYEEFEAKLLEYEDAEDMEGYEAYYLEISGQATSAYVLYEDLSEKDRSKVTNIDKLMEFEWMWSASTMQVEQGIDVYQVNSFTDGTISGTKSTIFHNKSAAEYGVGFKFSWWTAIVVEETSDGTLYVAEIDTNGADGLDKRNIKATSENGFVLYVWHGEVKVANLDIEVGDIVFVPFGYTTTKAYTGSSYGTISFSDLKGNEDKLTIVQGADTRDLITVNLYDYDSRINDPYNSNENYPGFQQDKGQLTATQTYHSNFGNNITSDLAAGHEGLTIANGTNINATVDGGYGLANSPISGVMLSTLKDGYPALVNGTSLKYLFTDNSGYGSKINQQSINGLFQYNETTGAYTFNSRENHAQYNASDDTFTLYDQIISSNFIWYPFGNFLPFNDIVQQSTQASETDKEYFLAVASRARTKYNQDMGSEYQKLANVLEDWIILMDSKYPNGWTGADAMNEYFNGIGPGNKEDINFDFNKETELLNKVYSIDYDNATDFYFGMDMYMEFMQPKDGLTGLTGQEPMEFYFTGDDDVWVYVDGKLFLDLSGIHRHVGGKIDFVNGIVEYYALDVATGDVSTTPYKTQTFENILGSTDGLNEKGTFENYSTHTFNFYYMERGAGSGVCRMNFNFPLLRQNSISVTKELSVDDENVKELLGNPDFKFQVYKENGTDLFVGANKEYEIYNEIGQKVGTGVTDANGMFAIKAGQTAVFSGIEENAGKYFVRELLDESIFEQYGKVSVDGQSTTKDSYTNVTVGSDTFRGIDSSLKDVSDGSTSFTFNNNVATEKIGSLTITKEVDGEETDNEFEFTVKLDEEVLPVGTIYKIRDADEEITDKQVDTAGVICLKAGETAEISGVLAGSKFEVQETTASAKGYTVQYSGESIGTDENGRQFVTGIITPATKVSVVVKNILKGTEVQISGTKILEHPDGKEHIYQIELVEVTDQTGQTIVENGNVLTTEVVFNNEAQEIPFSFTIPYKEKDIENFPKDFFYRITEIKDDDDWTTEYDESTYVVQVTVSKNEDDELSAKVTNIWKDDEKLENAEQIIFTNKQLYALTLTKKFEGETIDPEKKFTFEILLSQNDSTLSGTYKVTKGNVTGEIIFNEGSAQIELQADESMTIHGLPYGATWIIKETGADGYIVKYKIGEQNEVTNEETIEQKLSQSIEVVYTNYQSYELPEAGGIGANPFIIGGLVLMCGAIFLLYNNKKRGKEETASS